MNRYNIIQNLIYDNDYKHYLEIGLGDSSNINKICCDYKTGVDTEEQLLNQGYDFYKMTSDEYFLKHTNKKFDIIFIDGLHHADQVYRDINNSLSILNKNGTIVCHDMNPYKERIQKVPRETKIWTGDCWKAWVKIREERKDLEMFVVDTDFGCGIIKFGSQKLLKRDKELTYKNLDENRKEWLNLIGVEEFLRKITGD